jgi:sec-independent protein translocase protein TatB
VLGPEKLPRVVSELGRWVGRARGMARQFREQLEEEVQLEEARKARQAAAPTPTEPVSTTAPGNGGADALRPETAPPSYSNTHHADPAGTDPSANQPTQAAGADERRT